MGIDLREEDAIRWLTINPAKALGIDKQTGSLEPGKMADVVLWSGNPFSVYSRAEKVYIDGALVYDRNDPARQPQTDFELGIRDGRGGEPMMRRHGLPTFRSSLAGLALAGRPACRAAETVAITGATIHTMGPAGDDPERHAW